MRNNERSSGDDRLLCRVHILLRRLGGMCPLVRTEICGFNAFLMCIIMVFIGIRRTFKAISQYESRILLYKLNLSRFLYIIMITLHLLNFLYNQLNINNLNTFITKLKIRLIIN